MIPRYVRHFTKKCRTLGTNGKGLSTIEMLFALLISGLLSSSLFFVLSNIQTAGRRINTVIEVTIEATALKNQIEKDLLAACVLASDIRAAEQKKQKKEKEVKDKKEEAPFIGRNNKNGMLEELQFITTNRAMVSAPHLLRKMPIARVTYQLKQNKDDTELYTLTRTVRDITKPKKRQEQQKEKTAYTQELSRLVKNMTIEYVYEKVEEKKEQPAKPAAAKKDEKTAPQKKARTMITVKEWKEGADEKRPLIPERVIVSLTLVDATKTTEQTMSMSISLLSYHYQPVAIKKAAPPASKSDKKKEEEQAKKEANKQDKEKVITLRMPLKKQNNTLTQNMPPKKEESKLRKAPTSDELRAALKELAALLRTS